jgi:hypothetical protein
MASSMGDTDTVEITCPRYSNILSLSTELDYSAEGQNYSRISQLPFDVLGISLISLNTEIKR